MEETLKQRVRVLSALLHFYGNFLKVALQGMKEVIGEKGAVGILKFSSRKYGSDIARMLMRFTGSSSIKDVLEQSMSRLRVDPEVEEGENFIEVRIKRCPFWRIRGDPLLCAITEGFLEGVGSLFGLKTVKRIQTKMGGASECIFRFMK